MSKHRAKSVLRYTLFALTSSSKQYGNLTLFPLLTLKYIGIKSIANGDDTLVYNWHTCVEKQTSELIISLRMYTVKSSWFFFLNICSKVTFILNLLMFQILYIERPTGWFLFTGNFRKNCFYSPYWLECMTEGLDGILFFPFFRNECLRNPIHLFWQILAHLTDLIIQFSDLNGLMKILSFRLALRLNESLSPPSTFQYPQFCCRKGCFGLRTDYISACPADIAFKLHHFVLIVGTRSYLSF